MKPEEFRRILEEAIAGSHEALERIFELYDPLINKHSRINGKLDEGHIIFRAAKFFHGDSRCRR